MKNSSPAQFEDQPVPAPLPESCPETPPRENRPGTAAAIASHHRAPHARQHVDRKHVPGEKEAEQHVDEQQRADFQKPEADHAQRGFQKEAQQKRHHQRSQKAASTSASGQPAKIAAAQIKHQRKRARGHDVIHQLVRHAAQQQKADHVDRLDQKLLDLAIANLHGDASSQARHAGKRPADHVSR